MRSYQLNVTMVSEFKLSTLNKFALHSVCIALLGDKMLIVFFLLRFVPTDCYNLLKTKAEYDYAC